MFILVFPTPAAVVGLESTLFQVSEGMDVVEVCAIVSSALVYSPNSNLPCPIDFPFDVNLSTCNNSAGNEHN